MLGLHDGIWLFLVFFTQSMIPTNLQHHKTMPFPFSVYGSKIGVKTMEINAVLNKRQGN